MFAYSTYTIHCYTVSADARVCIFPLLHQRLADSTLKITKSKQY